MVKNQCLASPTAAAHIQVKYFTLTEAGFSHAKKRGIVTVKWCLFLKKGSFVTGKSCLV